MIKVIYEHYDNGTIEKKYIKNNYVIGYTYNGKLYYWCGWWKSSKLKGSYTSVK